MTNALEIAYFAAGCFWGIEKSFSEVEGVVETSVGYMGGDWPEPTYEQVCSGETGHAETVRIAFDPARVSYRALLTKFWRRHNPTCLNYQGWDVGTQYRTEIFYSSEQQRLAAEESRLEEESSGRHNEPIVTKITPAGTFWKAEEYHQQYLFKSSE